MCVLKEIYTLGIRTKGITTIVLIMFPLEPSLALWAAFENQLVQTLRMQGIVFHLFSVSLLLCHDFCKIYYCWLVNNNLQKKILLSL